MIRYAIGDLAREVEQHKCKCGRNHRAIGEIIGRRQALIKCDSGVWLPGTFFAHFFKEFEYCVRQYQVIQEKEGVFSIRIIPTSQFNSENSFKIIESLRKFVGNTKIELIIVPEIPLLKTGKRTPVVSKLSEKFLPENIQTSSD
jgi:phenylacetate-CoA ligase